MTAREAPRVPFSALLERGLIAAGAKLVDAKKKHRALVRADGAVSLGEAVGSIHRIGALAQGLEACNGWAFWHVETPKGLISIDALRAEIRAADGGRLTVRIGRLQSRQVQSGALSRRVPCANISPIPKNARPTRRMPNEGGRHADRIACRRGHAPQAQHLVHRLRRRHDPARRCSRSRRRASQRSPSNSRSAGCCCSAAPSGWSP